MERYAYLRDNNDGTWGDVIVAKVGEGKGEVIDALLGKPKPEIDAYVEKWLGPHTRHVWPNA